MSGYIAAEAPLFRTNVESQLQKKQKKVSLNKRYLLSSAHASTAALTILGTKGRGHRDSCQPNNRAGKITKDQVIHWPQPLGGRAPARYSCCRGMGLHTARINREILTSTWTHHRENNEGTRSPAGTRRYSLLGLGQGSRLTLVL